MKKYDLKKPYNYVLYLAIVLTVIGLILTATQINKTPPVRVLIIASGYLLVLYYAFVGYQKPHGNLLRYLILCFGVLLILTTAVSALAPQMEPSLPAPDVANEVKASPTTMIINSLIIGLCILLSGYIAGRLNKIRENRILFALTLVLLIIRVFVSAGNQSVMLSDFNEVILFFDIACSYFVRYQQHKEAGLQTE